MSKILDFLGAVAPTVASVFGGPMAGAAVQAIGSALGMSEPTKEKITAALESGQMNAEQLAALKQADLALKSKLAELGVDAEKIAAADRDSARKMQIETRSWVPALLATIITIGFYGVLIGLLTGDLKLFENSGLTMLVGALSTSWGAVVMFYFGASHQPSK